MQKKESEWKTIGMSNPTPVSHKLCAPGSSRGFSLIEMIVAVGLFAIVMVICTSTLFALVNANRKAQALQSVMNNLNVALDGMARAIRMGSAYHCGAGDESLPQDCPNGNATFIFEKYGGIRNNSADQWRYVFDSTGVLCGGGNAAICKAECNGQVLLGHATIADCPVAYYPLTSPEIIIDEMSFYVVGTCRPSSPLPCPAGDIQQPKVVIVVKGTAGATNNKTRSTFHIQVGASQRLLDL